MCDNARGCARDLHGGVNARELDASDIAPKDPATAGSAKPIQYFDLIVGDLSFISQTLVLPALVPLLKPRVAC
jgi:23S rRNA (cytidine1920-2'-O)/16S rRNA (cytidine1409-2'-O)-methyltransferase